jgi:RNA polymerase sigma factor (sigma-70 family)
METPSQLRTTDRDLTVGAAAIGELRIEDRLHDLRSRCAALFREHNDAIVRTVYLRLFSWDEATDVAQEVYVRVFRMSDPPPIHFLRAYLYKTALNLTADLQSWRTVRQLKEAAVCHEVYGVSQEQNQSPEEMYLEEEVRDCVRAAVHGLPEKCRQAYTLVELEGKSVKHTAQKMGVGQMAVYQLVRRAQGYLARDLVKRGWGP